MLDGNSLSDPIGCRYALFMTNPKIQKELGQIYHSALDKFIMPLLSYIRYVSLKTICYYARLQ